MPTAECHCNICGRQFEQLFFKGDRIDPICPSCKKRDVTIKTGHQRLMADAGMGSQLAGIPKGPS